MCAMQFHDQLVQRVAHVRDALTELNEALTARPRPRSTWATVLAANPLRATPWKTSAGCSTRIIGAAGLSRRECHDSDARSLRGSVELF